MTKLELVFLEVRLNGMKRVRKIVDTFTTWKKAGIEPKTVYKLLDDCNKEITEGPEIRELQRKYYQTLYQEEESVRFVLENNTSLKVDLQEQIHQNRDLELIELSEALASLKNGKCPGPDGISPEFYKTFWSKIRNTLFKVYKTSYMEMRMSDSQQQGILNLIPKGNKDARYLKNLRPITPTEYRL